MREGAFIFYLKVGVPFFYESRIIQYGTRI